MAIPNIVNVTSIQAKSFGNTLTTSNASVLVNAASSGNCIKVNNIVISNYSTAASTANVEYNTAATGNGTSTFLISQVSVPAAASLIVTDKTTAFYMEENTSIKAVSGTANALQILVSYEVIS
jgi:homoaconitase/3-isopropylmalate dehydratase large subunit